MTIPLRIQGKGPAVLFLHGTPTAPDVLRPIADALAPKHRTLEAVLPGYGGTSAAVPYDLDAVNRSIERALAAEGIAEVAIVGFSGGAHRALALALNGGIRVTAVACLGGWASFSDEERAGYRQFAVALRAGADLHPVAVQRFLSPAFAATHPAAIKQVEAWLDCVSPAVLADELEAFAAGRDLRAALASLTIPVVARVGALDVATPPAKSEDIVRAVPNASLEIVPGVGHALTLEDLEGTIASVRRALG